MAIDSIIKVSGAIAANDTDQNDIAAIDIPEDGEILAVGGILIGDYDPGPAASANFTIALIAELSFLSTNQFGANDARGTIAGIGCTCILHWSEAAETGGAGGKLSEFGNITFPEGITVNAGERIHLHGSSSLTDATAVASFLLYLKTKGGARRARSRR